MLLSVVVVAWFFVLSSGVEFSLPDNVLLGFATASYQVEGAWDVDGKGENIWDRLTHTRPELVKDRSNGDVAAESYLRYKQDVALLKTQGAQVYRFSLSWSRILPTGDTDVVNKHGVDYYNNLINELLANEIQPLVTLYHWDLPQPLQDIGGWPNPLLADYFEAYANVAFRLFGDRVKWWISFNEPIEVCQTSYGSDGSAPALNMSGIANYLCGHTLLLSHARAYHLYRQRYKLTQKGRVSITLSGCWNEPKTQGAEDIQRAEDVNQFQFGWFAHPVYTTKGDYPAVMRRNIDTNSRNEGRTRSRLPVFTAEQVAYIRGTFDYLALNHYTSCLVASATPPVGPSPSWLRDTHAIISKDPNWPASASDWLKVVPWGFRKVLNWVKEEYGNPDIFITENGYSDFGQLEDQGRIGYYREYLKQLSLAISADNCTVIGYTAWSLLDNFEWLRGYTEKFGIYYINYQSVDRTRVEKDSAAFMKHIYTTRNIPEAKDTSYIHILSNEV